MCIANHQSINVLYTERWGKNVWCECCMCASEYSHTFVFHVYFVSNSYPMFFFNMSHVLILLLQKKRRRHKCMVAGIG